MPLFLSQVQHELKPHFLSFFLFFWTNKRAFFLRPLAIEHRLVWPSSTSFYPLTLTSCQTVLLGRSFTHLRCAVILFQLTVSLITSKQRSISLSLSLSEGLRAECYLYFLLLASRTCASSWASKTDSGPRKAWIDGRINRSSHLLLLQTMKAA